MDQPKRIETETSQEGGLQLVPSGCTLLDLNMSGSLEGCYPLGRYVNIIGDYSSGKTLLAVEALSSLIAKYGKDAIAVYVEVEAAFDKTLMERMGVPLHLFQMPNDVEPGEEPPIKTIGDFYDDLIKRLKTKKPEVPMVYILDSLDAIEEEGESKQEGVAQTGKQMGKKAKELGAFLRKSKTLVEQKNCCVIIISQVRANIGVSFGASLTRSGGRALHFYSTMEIWLSEVGKLGTDVPIGIQVRAKNKKNKIFSAFREVDFNILWNYGIDDINSNLNYLDIASGNRKELFLGIEAQRKKMVLGIEQQHLQGDVKRLVYEKWLENEEKLKHGRNSKWEFLDE